MCVCVCIYLCFFWLKCACDVYSVCDFGSDTSHEKKFSPFMGFGVWFFFLACELISIFWHVFISHFMSNFISWHVVHRIYIANFASIRDCCTKFFHELSKLWFLWISTSDPIWVQCHQSIFHRLNTVVHKLELLRNWTKNHKVAKIISIFFFP